ncbi:MAG: glucose-6-phosphate isomerase, partial [Psychrobium sp.]
MKNRQALSSWKFLTQHAVEMKSKHLNNLFAADNQRFDKFSIKLPNMLFDYSKNLVTDETMAGLINLAKECEVESWRERMLSGEKINQTEQRAVLHTALRDRSGKDLVVDGENVTETINAELAKMEAFVRKVRQGEWKGYSGKRITDVVNIGVGGSNLGPQMVTEALKHHNDSTVDVHYISNVDGAQIAEVLRPLNPENVLFIVSSKTFTTTETITNAKTARAWLTSSSFDDEAVKHHFVAVTSNLENATAFGIHPDNLFSMWDWVGGRFSLWSAIGLPIALDMGFEKFMQLLEGAHEMDQHFINTP